jgi:hypothetical protein
MNFVKNWNANAPFSAGTKRFKSAMVYPRRGGPANVPRTTNHSLSKQVDQTNLNKKLFFQFFYLFIRTYILQLSLDSEIQLRECLILLPLLDGLVIKLILSQCSPHSSGLLHSQILGDVLRSSRSLADALLLLLVVHSKDSSNVLADRLDLSNFGCSTSGYLCNLEVGEFLTVLVEKGEEIVLGLSTEFVCLDHFRITVKRRENEVVSNRFGLNFVTLKTSGSFHLSTI